MIDPLYLHIDSSLEHIDPYVTGVQLMVRQTDLDTKRVGSVVDELFKLTDDAALAVRFKHSLLLSFEGFADGSFNVYKRPNYRMFVQQLNRQWPFWLHFLQPAPVAWKTLLLCLAYESTDGLPAEEDVIQYVDEKKLGAELQRMADAMMRLHAHLGMEETMSRQIFSTSMDAARGVFKDLP